MASLGPDYRRQVSLTTASATRSVPALPLVLAITADASDLRGRYDHRRFSRRKPYDSLVVTVGRHD